MVSKPKICLSSHSFGEARRSGQMTLEDAIAYAAELGVDGFEIVTSQWFPDYPFQTPYELLELRDLLKSLRQLFTKRRKKTELDNL